MEKGIVNAKISGTMLGVEDHGIFTSWLHLEVDGGGVGFGGYVLGGKSGIDFIKRILEVVGVESWEDLRGKYIRLDTEGWGGRALGIGNIIKDEWIYPKEFFNERKKDGHDQHDNGDPADRA